MVKKTMVNTGNYTRRWDGLQFSEGYGRAGTTLELDPGEKAEVMVPEDFEDSVLQEAKVGSPARKKMEFQSPAETAKEQ